MTYRTVFSAVTLMMMALLVVTPQPAAAQEARSFEQLQLLVKPGDRIFVTDAKGKVTDGKVASLTKSSLSLMTKTSTKDWSESDVLKIRQWRPDSLKNGALIGAGAGLGLSIVGAAIYCVEYRGCGAGAAAIIGVYTGIGAGIGVGIDALIPSKKTVYLGGKEISLNRLKVKPLISNSRKGVAVAFSF
jgi:hypothetical protein